MRPFLTAIGLVLAAFGLSTYAHARPYRVDYHGAICKPPSGSGNVTTGVDGVHAITASTVICPLNNIVSVGDTNLANMLFKVRYLGTISCELREEGLDLLGVNASGTDTQVATSSAAMNLPIPGSASSFPPMNMYLICDLAGDSRIQTIQVNTWTTPAPPP